MISGAEDALHSCFFCFCTIVYRIFIVRIKAAIEYIRNEQDEWVVFSFYTGMGIIRYEFKVPLVKKADGKVKFKLVKGQAREMHGGAEKARNLDRKT